MTNLKLPYDSERPLPFYLAMEEWAARQLPAAEWFFVWRVAPTVICGRNQDIALEVDLDYCRRNGIAVVRRRSGGGAVYADRNNYMFSYITPSEHVTTVFASYTAMVAAMLRGLGVEAEATGRNDILVQGRKISGNAYYHLPGRSIVHGTVLYDYDGDRIAGALTPSRAKLQSKKVVSAAMRVTSLREQGLDMALEDFGRHAVTTLCHDSRVLTDDEIAQIEELARRRYPAEPLIGARADAGATALRCFRFEGVGEITAHIHLSGDRIAGLKFSGDYFDGAEAGSLRRLVGLPYERKALAEAVESIDPGEAIAGLTRPDLLTLLIDS